MPLLPGSVDTMKTRLPCVVAARKATAEASVYFISNECAMCKQENASRPCCSSDYQRIIYSPDCYLIRLAVVTARRHWLRHELERVSQTHRLPQPWPILLPKWLPVFRQLGGRIGVFEYPGQYSSDD